MATKNITLTNLEIYTTAQALMESITTDINLPVKVGFYIQKNMKKMTELAQEIEKSRMEIFDKYGEKDEENNQYKFDKSVQEQVQKELNDLFDLRKGDFIYLKYLGKTYTYKVFEIEYINKNEFYKVQYNKNYLYLVTCDLYNFSKQIVIKSSKI